MSPPPGGGGWSREGGHQGSPKGPEPGRAEVRRFHSFATTVFEAWEGGCNRKVKYYPGSGHLQSHRVIKLQDKSKLDSRLHSRWERPGGWWKETVKYSPLQRASERWTQTQSSGRWPPPGSSSQVPTGRPWTGGQGTGVMAVPGGRDTRRGSPTPVSAICAPAQVNSVTEITASVLGSHGPLDGWRLHVCPLVSIFVCWTLEEMDTHVRPLLD